MSKEPKQEKPIYREDFKHCESCNRLEFAVILRAVPKWNEVQQRWQGDSRICEKCFECGNKYMKGNSLDGYKLTTFKTWYF